MERDIGCVLLKCLIVVFAAIRGNEGTMVIAVLNKLRGYEVHSLMWCYNVVVCFWRLRVIFPGIWRSTAPTSSTWNDQPIDRRAKVKYLGQIYKSCAYRLSLVTDTCPCKRARQVRVACTCPLPPPSPVWRSLWAWVQAKSIPKRRVLCLCVCVLWHLQLQRTIASANNYNKLDHPTRALSLLESWLVRQIKLSEND